MTLTRSDALTPPAVSTFSALSPIVVAVFLGFLAFSVPLGALSLEIGHRLGFDAVVVGAVIGLQSLATLVTRHKAGGLADHRGPRFAVLWGLPITASSGLLYDLSTLPLGADGSLALLVLGQLIMGLGQSLFLTGLMSWGIARMGESRTGKVMSWTGIAIYASLAVGAPVGLAVQAAYGFAVVGAVVLIAPAVAFTLSLFLPPTPASGTHRVPFHRVIGLIWKPGLVLALATVPFAVMEAFLPLYYTASGWSEPGVALFAFGAAYIVVRLIGSGFADRFGASPVAICSLCLEAVGQALLWLAPVSVVAVAGAALTGAGFSLIFPSMGVLATRSVPPAQRGRAVGNFIAFSDMALGVTAPAVGLLSQSSGIASAFLVGTCATCAAVVLLPSVRAQSQA
ncbi:MFS family permease [Rhizobium sp. BK529]|uniref:MFS transporter n=1 Tax=unclassified Rhizobium TaxID=2613769 RepID=UPI0010DBB1D7|nr:MULTISPECIES: MFS transporter [unclassified Rhizobium]MBB3595009.1 MFS family permease [Rhizobium sp. BK529]TCR98731.1 putative MFS family arabinose efflux permease [Rhizobium sp. BK418]